MFDLEQAITEWRKQMLAAGIKSPVPLEELEIHLRDEIERQMQSGSDERHAFETAVLRIGQAGVLKREFVKAGGTKWAVLRQLKVFLLGADKIPFPSPKDFAPAAKLAMEFAPAEARRFHHNFIGTEHILLGLTKSKSEIVDNVMQRLGVSSEAVRAEIEKFVGNGPVHEVCAQIPFTPRARTALQLAAGEARVMNQTRINAEHIFLGLILEGNGVAAVVLKKLGVELERARKEILSEMRAKPGAA